MNTPIGTGSMLVAFGFSMMNDITKGQERWKQRIRDEWEKSKNYPRKKKKRVRKELMLDWAFANYDPFDGFKL